MECRDFIRRSLDKTFPVVRAKIEKEACTCPLSLENEHFSLSSFFFLRRSLPSTDQNWHSFARSCLVSFSFLPSSSFPFRSHGSFSFFRATQLSFSIYSLSLSPPSHWLVFLLLVLAITLFPSGHGENVVSHLMLAGHQAPHIKGVWF